MTFFLETDTKICSFKEIMLSYFRPTLVHYSPVVIGNTDVMVYQILDDFTINAYY